MIIQTNELKIGNWVFDSLDNSKPIQIENGYDLEDGEYSPIPLTPEVLEACGFLKSDDAYEGYLSSEIITVQPVTSGRMRIREDLFGFYYESSFVVRVTSLHHLMNLYHSLTGQEIVYSPLK